MRAGAVATPGADAGAADRGGSARGACGREAAAWREESRRPWAAALPATAALLLGVAACGGEPGGDDPGREGTEAGAEEEAPAASAVGDSPAVGTGRPPAAETAAGEGASRPLRSFRFRIRNGGDDTVVVVADAGAGTRTLDTVPPADSSAVRVETRAPLLELTARLLSGRETARSRFDLERAPGDTLLEFVADPGAADSAGR